MTPEQRQELIVSLWQTHKEAANRNNSSKLILEVAWDSNGNNLRESIIAALCSFGGRHAPIKTTYLMLRAYKDHPDKNGYLANILNNKDIIHGKIPGFGSSMVKGEHDPLLADVAKRLHEIDPEWDSVALSIHKKLYGAKGISVFPNLAFYTAAVMLTLDVPLAMCEYIAIGARVEAWTDILFGKVEP